MKAIRNEMAVKRQLQLNKSPQLVLTELILLLTNVNKSLPVIFAKYQYYPSGLSSWRGSYDELAIEYDNQNEPPTAKEFLATLTNAVGKTMTGYKGGDYTISKLTPIWMANYGSSNGPFAESVAITGVTMMDNSVLIETEEIEYLPD